VCAKRSRPSATAGRGSIGLYGEGARALAAEAMLEFG
jgi:hypothetical protein